jgi:hypothetical protein
MAEEIWGFQNASAQLVAGANITISQSGGTVTIIGNTNSGATTFLLGVSTDGNSAGTTGTVNNQMELVGGANITLSQSKNANSGTITIVGAVPSGSLGMSNLGNTSGTTGVVSGSNLRYLIVGGNNVTLSQSINGSSGTLTISANQTANVHNLTISGNTSGVLAAVSSGTLTLAGGNNITLSQAGNAVTISAFTESQSFGMSNIGNTSGTTGIASGSNMQFVLAGGNNITLSQSINGASGTITVSGIGPGNVAQSVGTIAQSGTNTGSYAAIDHIHAGVPLAGVSTMGNTAGSTAMLAGKVFLVGGNHITLSMSTDVNNGMTISIVGV